MTKPTIRIHNSETDEVIDREMTDAEYAEHLKYVSAREAELAKIASNAEAKLALLDRLGITAEEAALLLS